MALEKQWHRPIRPLYGLNKVFKPSPPQNDKVNAGELEDFQPSGAEVNQASYDFFFLGLFTGNLDQGKTAGSYLYFGVPEQIFRWPFKWSISGHFVLIGKRHPMMQNAEINSFSRDGEGRWIDLSPEEIEKVEHLIKGIIQETSSEIKFETLVNTYLSLLIPIVVRIYKSKSSDLQSANNITINFKRELNQYYAEPTAEISKLPSVAYLAKRLKVSPNYLSQTLKMRTGKSALDHIHEHIVDKAKELIANPSLSITQIACQLGFEYPNYFARLFRKKTGMSPSQYRGMLYR